MKLNLKKFSLLVAVGMLMLSLPSCVKNEIDDPPANGVDPALTPNTTIAHLKSLYINGIMTINSDLIIKGVVVGDDQSGNLYKSVVIQDSTGGISIEIDQSSYYTTYKVGRNVFVKCKGLVLGDYHGLIQLGGYIDNSTPTAAVGRIPQSLVPVHLIGGLWNQPYNIKVVSDLRTLNKMLDQNTLVKLVNVHFQSPCLAWADIPGQTSGNRNLDDAFSHLNDTAIVVRTSNYATFGADLIPQDSGNVTGIFQIYGSTPQLIIRQLSDVQGFTPCVPSPPVGTGSLMSVGALRPLFTNPTTIVNGTKIRGVVISDIASGNITSKNLVLQDGASGILVRFRNNNTLLLNDSIEIDLSGDSLTMFNGLLQINNVYNSSAILLGTGSVTPRIATIADIVAAGTTWESTLVKIANVTSLTGGTAGTWSGQVTIGDGTGTIHVYTRSLAGFAGSPYPTSAASITGYINTFNSTSEINIRNLSDVQ